MINTFMSWFPDWYIAACLITGFVVLPIMTAIAMRPLLRGLSHGLWEVVIFYKCGVSFWRVFKRFVRAVLIDLPFWGLMNGSVTRVTNNVAGWYGIFRWSFEKDFNRANSIKEARANKKK
ncbi:hypothetical protein LU11_gp386 [Pseudomonas phage Lu11]|uniref:hypothetical protein n=1 Tax=Pseudomonas phage Lu11 TaxID=1161927 RepID=UPI00025F18DF|nr:hypothetical protein LU11_gp386 [Pseudomonas phage Lu11]AFH14917.1 hypothetical protein Lu11_0379 [Pseudomonas phage Lu11]